MTDPCKDIALIDWELRSKKWCWEWHCDSSNISGSKLQISHGFTIGTPTLTILDFNMSKTETSESEGYWMILGGYTFSVSCCWLINSTVVCACRWNLHGPCKGGCVLTYNLEMRISGIFLNVFSCIFHISKDLSWEISFGWGTDASFSSQDWDWTGRSQIYSEGTYAYSLRKKMWIPARSDKKTTQIHISRCLDLYLQKHLVIYIHIFNRI